MIPIPSYLPTVAIQTVVADLSQFCLGSAPLPWPSHIVVIDDQHRPQGCLALGLLWSRQQGQGGDPPAVYLQDCLAWLEPVVPLVAHTTPADLIRLITHSSAPCWVVVDVEGRYLGVLNGADLLAQGSLSPAVAPLSATSVQEQQWVMTISHALKTPLTSLLGLSTLLLDHRVGHLNDRQSRYAGLMRRAIRKLIRLVNQLVDWMRLEAGQMDLDRVPVDLNALTETLLPTFLTSWLPDAAAPPPWMDTFRCQLPPQVPLLRVDRLRLQQSIYSVLGYLLHRGAIPQTLTLESWGSWVGLTLRATPETDDRLSPSPGSPPWTVTLGAEVDGLETLGLALARRLCQQQGGDLVGFCSPLDGYQITILLPWRGGREAGDEPGLMEEDPSDPVDQTSAAAGDLAQDGPAGIDPGGIGPERLVLLVSADGEWLVHTQAQMVAGETRLLLATHWQEAVDMAQRLTPALVLLHGASLGEIPANPGAVLAQVAPQAVLLVLDNPKSLAQALAPLSTAQSSANQSSTNQSSANQSSTAQSSTAQSLTAQPSANQSLTASPSAIDYPPGPDPANQGRVTPQDSTPQNSTPKAPATPLTLLVLTYPGQSALTKAQVALPEVWRTTLQSQRCRLVQANDLAQARLLCRVWQPQAIVLVDGLGFTETDWDWVAQCPELIQIPWVSLSAMTGSVPSGLRIVDGSMDPPVSETITHLLQSLQTRADSPDSQG